VKAVLLLAALLGVYGPGLAGPLVYDDATLILQTPLVTGPWPGASEFLTYTYSAQDEYEPLVFFLHWALFRLPGPKALYCRLASVVLHWLVCLLLFKLCRKAKLSETAAAAATLLFAFYPGHTEILGVAAFKKHLLVSAAALTVFNAAVSPLSWVSMAGAWLAFALGLLAKESAAMIPALAFLAQLAARPSDKKYRAAFHAGLWTALGLFLAVRVWVVPRAYPPILDGSWLRHALTSGKCLLWSLSQLPAAWSVCLEHSIAPVASAAEAAAVSAALALLVFVVLWAWLKDRWAGFGLTLAALALVPFLNLLPFLNYSLVANRYLYLSAAGCFLFLARLAPPQALLAAVPIGLIYGGLDLRAMREFGRPYELWTRTAHCAPTNPRAQTALGLVQLEKRLYPEAEASFKKALELSPTIQLGRVGLADVYAKTGRLEEAIAIVKDEASRNPSLDAYAVLGNLYLQNKQFDKALVPFGTLLHFSPAHPVGRPQMGFAFLAKGDLDRAEYHLLLAAEQNPKSPVAYKYLAELYRKRGNLALAAGLYEKSLAIAPVQADAAINLSALYAKKNPEKARAVLDAFLAKLAPTLEETRARNRPEDRQILADATEQYERALKERERLPGK
jgi:tetratricopeptide (TPR) repeat protein